MSAHAPPGEIRDIGIGRAPVLAGILGIPGAAKGLVIFAHGSGSSRKSPRNTYVAGRLHQAGWRRCFSICSRQKRNWTAATCSTSRFSPSG